MTTTVRQLLDEKGHNVITVGADDTVFDAVSKMAEENIGSLIVCEGSKVIGIITERHYARNVFLEGRALPNTRVGDVMETPVLFIGPDLTAEECMAVMTEKRVRYLPVIDEGKLTEIISIGDLVKILLVIINSPSTSCLIICTGHKNTEVRKAAAGNVILPSVGLSWMTRRSALRPDEKDPS